MRRITEQDNPAIAAVIRTVSAEYGLTADKGYTVADPNLDELFSCTASRVMPTGSLNRTAVVGGGGIAPLLCSEPDICELQKMYFLPTIRGQGGEKLALVAWNMHAHRALNVATSKPPLSLKRPLACMSIWALSISMRHWAARATWTAKSGC